MDHAYDTSLFDFSSSFVYKIVSCLTAETNAPPKLRCASPVMFPYHPKDIHLGAETALVHEGPQANDVGVEQCSA